MKLIWIPRSFLALIIFLFNVHTKIAIDPAEIDPSDNPPRILSETPGYLVTIIPSELSLSTPPGSSVDYAHAIQNAGDSPDGYQLEAISSQGFGNLIYHDFDCSGTLEAWELSLGPINQTGELLPGAEQCIIVRIDIPAGTENLIDVTTLTATSFPDLENWASATDHTSIIPIPGISGWVFLDENGDGWRQAGEAGFKDIQVTLTDGFQTWLTTTDFNGWYAFSEVPPGDYLLEINPSTLPPALLENQTADPDISDVCQPSCDQLGSVHVEPGQGYPHTNFGYNWALGVEGNDGYGAIGDRVWTDIDGDGLQDPDEPGLPGVEIFLTTDLDQDGWLDDEYPCASTITDENGNYIFDGDVTGYGDCNGMGAGIYTVELYGLPPDYTQTFDPDDELDDKTSTPLLLAPGDVYLNADFGYQPPSGATPTSSAAAEQPVAPTSLTVQDQKDFLPWLGFYKPAVPDVVGIVWNDLNADGSINDGASGLPGVTLLLYDQYRNVVAGAVTDRNGHYAFSVECPNECLIDVTDENNVLEGYWHSFPDGLPPNEVPDYEAANFGYYKTPASLGDLIWFDANEDGKKQTCEWDLEMTFGECVEQWLPDSEFGIQDPVSYCNYDCDLNDPWIYCCTIPGNQGLESFNYLNFRERPMQGVTAQLDVVYPNSNTVTIKTTSDQFGAYRFDNLLLDENFNGETGDGSTEPAFTLQVMPPPGMAPCPVDINGLLPDLWDSNNPGGEAISTLQGTAIKDLDYCFTPQASFGDAFWLDQDGDGLRDIGEPGLSGAELKLYADDDGTPGASAADRLVAAATSNPDGTYLFSQVPTDPYVHAGIPEDRTNYYLDVNESGLPYGLVVSAGADSSASAQALPERSFRDFDYGLAPSQDFTTLGDTGLIGDRLWSDADADGLFDPGEPGIGGVSLDLLAPDVNGEFTSLIASTWTAPSGAYYFSGLAPSKYRVSVSDSAGVLADYFPPATRLSAPIDLKAGQAYLNADFAYQPILPLSISGVIWHDLIPDGVRDLGAGPGGVFEPGIPRIRLELLDPLGAVIAVTNSDQQGAFVFHGLASGDYNLRIVDPNNQLQGAFPTTESAYTNLLLVHLDSGDYTAADFGYVWLDAIGGTAFVDANDNGILDQTESGISNLLVEIYRYTGAPDPPLFAKTYTAQDGSYRFPMLPHDEFLVSIPDQSLLSWLQLSTIDDDPASGAQLYVSPGLPNHVFLDADFGYAYDRYVDLSGALWFDLDADGFDDGDNDPPIPSQAIGLSNANGLVISTTLSDQDGSFLFQGIPYGEHRLHVIDKTASLEGYRLSAGLDSYPVDVMGGGGSITGIEIAFTRAARRASISGFVWRDADRDHVQDGAESGLGGVDLQLYEAGPDGQPGNSDDLFIGSAASDPAGYFSFNGLEAGLYQVLPEPGVGDMDPFPYSKIIPLAENEIYPAANFAFSSSTGELLGGRLWLDLDGNGIQDYGETGLDGVELNLEHRTLGAYNVTTGPDGWWSLDGLEPGPCQVSVDASTLPVTAGSTPTNGDLSRYYTIPGSKDVNYVDFGFAPATSLGGSPDAAPAQVGGLIYMDIDRDGTKGLGERGVQGVTVELYADPNQDGFPDDLLALATTQTDSDGRYSFSGLLPGAYFAGVSDHDDLLSRLHQSEDPDLSSPSPACQKPSDPIWPNCGDDLGWVDLAEGQSNLAIDFGYAPASGLIGDLLWHDLDGDGWRAPGEPGMQGIMLDLWLDMDGDQLFTHGIDNLLHNISTDALGRYWFGALPPAQYLIGVDGGSQGALAGLTLTSGLAGEDDHSQTNPYGVTLSNTDSYDLTADFGFHGTSSSISGRVFEDTNNNAIYEAADDDSVPGVQVQLFRDLNGDWRLDPTDPFIGSVITDSNGGYIFTNLPESSYLVQVNARYSHLKDFFQTTQLGTQAVQPIPLETSDSNGNDFGFYAYPPAPCCYIMLPLVIR